MIDPKTIASNYQSMTDEELMRFAQADGGGLTPEAFKLLQKEFSDRQLDAFVINSIKDGTYFQQKEALSKIENTVSQEFSTSVLHHALNDKRDGKSNEMILYSLMETGMDETKAALLLEQLEGHARRLYNRSNISMLFGSFICIAGIAFYLILPYTTVVTFMKIIAGCAVFFGLLKFFVSWINASKYASILRNIKLENSSGNKV